MLKAVDCTRERVVEYFYSPSQHGLSGLGHHPFLGFSLGVLLLTLATKSFQFLCYLSAPIPMQYKQVYRNTMTKLFADLELKKQRMEEAEANERKRQREEEDAIELKAKKEKEWKQEWEASGHTFR